MLSHLYYTDYQHGEIAVVIYYLPNSRKLIPILIIVPIELKPVKQPIINIIILFILFFYSFLTNILTINDKIPPTINVNKKKNPTS